MKRATKAATLLLIPLLAAANAACDQRLPWSDQAADHSEAPAGGDGVAVPPAQDAARVGPVKAVITQRGTDQDCDTQLYVFPKSVRQLKESLQGSGLTMIDGNLYKTPFATWVAEQKGWRAAKWIRFTVQSDSDHAAVLTGMTIDVLKQEALTSRTIIMAGDGCGGALEPRLFGVDFNTSPPKITALPGRDDNGDTVPGVKFPFTVSASDPEVFDLVVQAGPVDDIQWHATISYTLNGEAHTTIVDDGGSPLHTVARSDGVPQATLPIG